MEEPLRERARQGVLRVVGDDRVKALTALLAIAASLCLAANLPADGPRVLAFFWRVSLGISDARDAPHVAPSWLGRDI